MGELIKPLPLEIIRDDFGLPSTNNVRGLTIVSGSPTGYDRRLAAVAEIEKQAKRSGINMDIVETEHPEHARELARDAQGTYHAIFGDGGDGTNYAILNGIKEAQVENETPFGTLASGSMNVIARELGIPVYQEGKALAALMNGGIKPTDLISARADNNVSYALMSAGQGTGAQTIGMVEDSKKRGAGKYIEIATKGSKELEDHGISITNTGTGQTIAGLFRGVEVTNIGNYARFFRVVDGLPDDGEIELFVVPATRFRKVQAVGLGAYTGLRGKMGFLPKTPGLLYDRGTGFSISTNTDEPLRFFQADGERLPWVTEKVVYEADPSALKLLVPRQARRSMYKQNTRT